MVQRRFFGRLVQSWDVGALTLSESRYEPHTRLDAHIHARAYVSLVVNGGYRETCGARERSCLASTVIVHMPQERHANHFLSSGCRLFRVEMDDAWVARLHLEEPAEAHGGSMSMIVQRMFRELHRRDSAAELMIEGLLFELAAVHARSREESTGRRAPEWMARVDDYLDAHRADRVRLEDVARIAGVHEAHLNRTFRAHRGCSVGEQLRRLRVETAAHSLAHSRVPIAEIALAAGFADQSHFSRVFTRITGISPAHYRRLHSSHEQNARSRSKVQIP